MAKSGGVDGLQMARDMFDAYDALGRVLDSPSLASMPESVDGIRMIRDMMRGAFAKQGIGVIVPAAGDKFDPHIHESALQVRSPFPKGRIVDVHRHGFRIGKRMIRAAKVSVSFGN